MPANLFSYVWRTSRWYQLGLVVLSIIVFLLNTAPLELQRRIVNQMSPQGTLREIVLLAAAYAGLALALNAVKFVLNVSAGWVAENAVRDLRRRAHPPADHAATASGVTISLVLAETDPVGGFVGTAFSEPFVQLGMFFSIFTYLAVLRPAMAAIAFALFVPQLVLVPLLQWAINQRAISRITTLRKVSATMADETSGDHPIEGQIQRVFTLDMQIYKIKFSLNFLMNFSHHLSIAIMLGLGGWLVVTQQAEIGTVVAFVAGIERAREPWNGAVDWFRDMSIALVKYRMIAEAINALEQNRPEAALVEPGMVA